MGKIKEKWKAWKDKQTTKFFNQSNTSFQETRENAKLLATYYFDDEKMKTFSYEFKKPSHQKSMIISKKINFISYCALAGFLILFVLFAGFCYFTNLIPKSTEKFEDLNKTVWLNSFLPIIIMSSISVLFMIPRIILQIKRDKKFNSNPNYYYRFDKNLILEILSFVFFFLVFFTYNPFNFAPAFCLLRIKYNTPGLSSILIFTFIFGSLAFLSLLANIVSFILCECFNPKFNIKLLIKKE